jgi:ectoine hydroxylase-related dioxygenase (phytanoyl-CoA dioxygenase family)
MTRSCAEEALQNLANEERTNTRAMGTDIDSFDYPGLAPLIGNPRALAELNKMGLDDIRFWQAVIISKPPGGPRLYWHQDCFMWNDPRAYSDMPPMIFLMYYLDNTSRVNGCLRLLPGTHRKRHDLHQTGVAHDRETKRFANPEDKRFKDFPGEIDVPVKAGDVVVGDARIFHASHANNSLYERTLITIWLHPFFSNLREETQSFLHTQMHLHHASWPADSLEKIRPLIPTYNGNAKPMEWHRTPDNRLE